MFAQKVASDIKSMLGSIGGLIVISDDKDDTNDVKITKKYRLQPDTRYFYEMNYNGGKDMPVAVTAMLNRAAGEISADSAILNITGNSYTVTEIFEEDFSESDNTNKYFNGIVADRTADGVYHGAALNRSKDSSSGNKAISDGSELSFTVDKNKKAIISFDYDMKADRNNPDEVYISVDGERWYRNSGFSNSSGTYMHPHILESGEHVIEFGAKGYGKRPIETYIDIDNLRVIYIEETKGSVGNAKNSGSYESALGSGTDTLLEYEEGAAKGSFRTPERIVSFAGRDMEYINKIPENGSEGIIERNDTDKVKMLKINIPSNMKAVFTSVSLVSSPSEKHGVNWTFDNTNINVRKETNGNYYPMSVPNPLKMTSNKHEGSIEAKTAALYKAGAGFDAVEMVLTSSMNNSIEASKYFISPGTSEIYFEDEVFDGDVSISIMGSGEWTLSDFRLYYIENGKKVYVEDGYMNENDVLGFSVEGGRIEAEEVNNAQNNIAARIYKKGEIVNYGQTYYDYENDPSKAQYWRYTHTQANDGLHPDAGKVLSSPIEKFYIDGKYSVEHWQEDSTGRLIYDKTSNVAEMTFYIEGQAAAPWVEWIKTNPSKPEAGDNMNIVIAINDAEKDVLSLTTELYRDGKLVYTHKKDNIAPLPSGKYPEIHTGNVPGGACEGDYSVVCTVRDSSGSGLGFYDFKVKAGIGISGSVKHFAAW